MKFCDLIIFVGCLGAASTSSALSLGGSQGSVFLGSNIDLVFHVQADPGKNADSSCIDAEVWLGDVRLGNSQVRLETVSDSSVRVRTLQATNEPLVNIKLTAGCAGPISRSYTFFADPPVSMAASLKPIDLSSIQVASLPTAKTSLLPPLASNRPVIAKARPQPTKRAVNSKPTTRATTKNTVSTAPANADAPPPVKAPTPEIAPAISAQAAAASITEQPKLRMEALDGLTAPQTQGIQPPSADAENFPRNSSIDAHTQVLLDANARRLELLEQQLLAMQSTLSSNHTEIATLRSQLLQAQNEGLPLWVHVMLGLLALALATIAWLLQRIKQERQHTEGQWANTVLAAQDDLPSNAAPVSVTPATKAKVREAVEASAPASSNGPNSDLSSNDENVTSRQDIQPVVSNDSPDTAAQNANISASTPSNTADSTVALPSANSAEQAQASWATVLTAQALFDIQEQAEFYASVGEHDQAILLLEEHIAQNENSSPLAYLELLQLLYRLSRTEAFEHVSEKFQRHFNVRVPSFLRFARKGHDLWSSHPEVLSEIEAAWPTDDVLPLLRKLILASPQTQQSEPDSKFDLAAFDDLLMLYNVAQTTPAAMRGSILGRIRTAPQDTPLPEVSQEDSTFDPQTEFMPDEAFFNSSASPNFNLEALTATEPPPLPLHASNLEMLSASPAQAPLSANAPPSDSPFQRTSHFSNAEVLMDNLSIDWERSDAAPAPATTPSLPDVALSDPLFNEPLSTEALLNDPLLNTPNLSELNLDEFMVDERDLPSSSPKVQR